MTEKIHYEDNIFFLNSMVKTLKNGLSLDVDPEYFIDKVIEDVFFIDSTLARVFASLKENPYLIKRTDHLRSLLRVKKVFIDFLEEIFEGKLAFAVNLEPFFPKFRAARNEHIKDAAEIHALIDNPPPIEPSDDDIISAAEFQFLLKEDEPPDVPEK
jgi:hypothetical protein